MNFAIIALISVIAQLFAPWWVTAAIPFLILLWRPTSPSKAFGSGFLGIGIPWLVYGYYFHFISEGALSNSVSKIFFLPGGILLLIVSAALGGLVGGFSGLSGYWVRQLFQRGIVSISSEVS